MAKFIIGIDEVGRGALAGPVVVAAVALPGKLRIKYLELRIKGRFKNKKFKLKLRDSKKLSPRQRESWLQYIKKTALFYRIASVSPKVIDKINISQAANLAATRAFSKLIKNIDIRCDRTKCQQNYNVYLDGGLYIKNSKIQNLKTKTIIKGDEKIPAISLASIVAKVYRDKLMRRLHKKYLRYDFINNVGYGTKKHIKAIKKYGRSPIHRQSFKV